MLYNGERGGEKGEGGREGGKGERRAEGERGRREGDRKRKEEKICNLHQVSDNYMYMYSKIR